MGFSLGCGWGGGGEERGGRGRERKGRMKERKEEERKEREGVLCRGRLAGSRSGSR